MMFSTEQEVPSGGTFLQVGPSGVATALPGKPLLRGKEVKSEQRVSHSKAVFCESGESYFFGNQNLSFHMFAAQEIGRIGNNKLELTGFILDNFEL